MPGIGQSQELKVGDIEIGAIEIKDGASDDRALVSDASTARANTNHVLSVQQLDASGKVPPAGEAVGNAPFAKVTDGNDTWLISGTGNGNVDIAAQTLASVKIGDGTNAVDMITTQANNQAFTLNGLVTTSVLYASDGATLDMLQVGATGELQVTDVASRPGEDAANDRVKVKKVATETVYPAKTTTTVDSLEDILASTEVLGYPNLSVFVKNTGAAALTALNIEVSPDGTSWVTLPDAPDAGTHMFQVGWSDTLAASAICVYSITSNSYRYLRVQANCATSTTVDAWLVGNLN